MYLTEVLNSSHNRNDFCCGKEILDIYFKTQATQDIKRKLSACFVLTGKPAAIVKGYYTLSNSSIPIDFIPEQIQKKLPKSYKNIPATLLGRLAVDLRYQGKGAGQILLIDALKRCNDISKTIGSFAVIVDPLDQNAEEFYLNYGFIKLPDSGKMFLPIKTIELLFKD